MATVQIVITSLWGLAEHQPEGCKPPEFHVAIQEAVN